ncbi:hypothetical protein C8Q79DRAFT_989868 [Trametes meyenii]|nr:hypothetical protein C8Q79DRAFT_989868 [Trametes meyenii]
MRRRTAMAMAIGGVPASCRDRPGESSSNDHSESRPLARMRNENRDVPPCAVTVHPDWSSRSKVQAGPSSEGRVHLACPSRYGAVR